MVPAGTMPLVPFNGVVVNVVPLQVVTVIAVTAAIGLIVTVTANAAPTHDPLVGVTIYVAVTVVLFELISVPKIPFCVDCPDPFVKPVPAGADQV